MTDATPSAHNGEMRVQWVIANVVAVMSSVPQPWSAERATINAVAPTRPTDTGMRPACNANAQRDCLNWWNARTIWNATAEAGPHIQTVATSAPGMPATCWPIRVTINTFGPGAACAIATSWVNWVLVIQ